MQSDTLEVQVVASDERRVTEDVIEDHTQPTPLNNWFSDLMDMFGDAMSDVFGDWLGSLFGPRSGGGGTSQPGGPGSFSPGDVTVHGITPGAAGDGGALDWWTVANGDVYVDVTGRSDGTSPTHHITWDDTGGRWMNDGTGWVLF